MSQQQYTGTGNGSQMYTTAMTEKRQMDGLNSHLSSFMDKIRNICQNSAASVDPSKYHELLRTLEAEINKLKNMYEGELTSLRRQLDEANRQLAIMSANVNNNRDAMGDMQAKVVSAEGRAQKAENEINNLNRMLAAKDKEIADLKAALKGQSVDLDRLRPEYGRLSKDLEALRRELDAERKARKEAEAQVRGLSEKVNFDGKVASEQQKDLTDRIRIANDIIATLENKLKQLANDRSDRIPQLLQRLRDGTAEDMRKFQRETEAALSGQLSTLKRQMDDDATARESLARQKAQLEEALRRLEARVNALDGENEGLKRENAALKVALDKERAEAQQRLRDVEGRLRELQGQLMIKVKDFNTSREAQQSLQAEIDQYRSLLEVGKETLGNCPVAGACGVPQNTSRPGSKMYTSRPGTTRACCSNCTKGGPCVKDTYNKPSTGTGSGLPKLGSPVKGPNIWNNGWRTTYVSAYGKRNMRN